MIDYGQNVTLGTIDDDDVALETIRRWRNDRKIWQYCRQNDLISIGSQVRWYKSQDEDANTRMYLVIDRNHRAIGVCGLTSMDLVNRHAEFSLYIAPAFQRQGHGKHALKTLLSHGFNAYGLQVIWGESFVGNPAAQIFIDVGMKLDGIRRQFYYRDGRFIDAHLHSILREEWEKNECFNDCRNIRCST